MIPGYIFIKFYKLKNVVKISFIYLPVIFL